MLLPLRYIPHPILHSRPLRRPTRNKQTITIPATRTGKDLLLPREICSSPLYLPRPLPVLIVAAAIRISPRRQNRLLPPMLRLPRLRDRLGCVAPAGAAHGHAETGLIGAGEVGDYLFI